MTDNRFVDALTDHLDGYPARQIPDRSPAEDAPEPDREPESDGAVTTSMEPAADDADFATIVAELRRESTWSGPPPDLRASILAAVRAEQANGPPGVDGAAGIAPAESTVAALDPGPAAEPESQPESESRPGPESKSRPEPESKPRPESQQVSEPESADPTPETVVPPVVDLQAHRARRTRLIWVMTTAAAVAAAFAAGILTANEDQTPTVPAGKNYLAVGTSLAPAASAKVTVASGGAGFSIQLDLRNLPPAAPDQYYAAWLRGPKGTVQVGTFHARRLGTPIKLWSGVDPATYPNLEVTRQSEGDLTTPSTQIVLRASLG